MKSEEIKQNSFFFVEAEDEEEAKKMLRREISKELNKRARTC